jgi:uncharacterized protein (TIGR00299 family) protein
MLTAYLDAFSGASGDMLVAAAIDAGADFGALKQALASLPITGYDVRLESKTLSGIAARRFIVEVSAPQPERSLAEIDALIANSGLSTEVKRDAVRAFAVLAEAEAKVHRVSVDRIHFHEVGAVDSIVDIVGAIWAFRALDVRRVLVSPLPMGNGFVSARHGPLPIPAPAAVELLAGFALRMGDGEGEMVTPTAAALIKTVGKSASMLFGFEIVRVGYGAGSREYADRPNVLRLFLGREVDQIGADRMLEVETNIDDLNPQIYAHLCERLFSAGARDVTITPTIMKKGRPGVVVSVLVEPTMREAIIRELFAETGTLGVRWRAVERALAPRESGTVATRFGEITVKVSKIAGHPLRITPEYEDCRAAATKHRVPLQVVMEEARAAARRQYGIEQ